MMNSIILLSFYESEKVSLNRFFKSFGKIVKRNTDFLNIFTFHLLWNNIIYLRLPLSSGWMPQQPLALPRTCQILNLLMMQSPSTMLQHQQQATKKVSKQKEEPLYTKFSNSYRTCSTSKQRDSYFEKDLKIKGENLLPKATTCTQQQVFNTRLFFWLVMYPFPNVVCYFDSQSHVIQTYLLLVLSPLCRKVERN